MKKLFKNKQLVKAGLMGAIIGATTGIFGSDAKITYLVYGLAFGFAINEFIYRKYVI